MDINLSLSNLTDIINNVIANYSYNLSNKEEVASKLHEAVQNSQTNDAVSDLEICFRRAVNFDHVCYLVHIFIILSLHFVNTLESYISFA